MVVVLAVVVVAVVAVVMVVLAVVVVVVLAVVLVVDLLAVETHLQLVQFVLQHLSIWYEDACSAVVGKAKQT